MASGPCGGASPAPNPDPDAATDRAPRTGNDDTHRVTLANRDGAILDVAEDEPIYDACEARGIAVPIACRYGGCITCAARLLSGKVRQPKGTALNRRQSQAGYILLCVARPTMDCVVEVGVECQDDLYRNPFAAPGGGR